MNPQSIVLVMALLTAGAPSHGQAVTPGAPQDYESIMKSMEKAQADASQPGDQQLTCPQLQEHSSDCAGSGIRGAREGRGLQQSMT